jgi:hypothetical protein
MGALDCGQRASQDTLQDPRSAVRTVAKVTSYQPHRDKRVPSTITQ